MHEHPGAESLPQFVCGPKQAEVLGLYRIGPGEQVVEQYPEAVDVALDRRGAAAQEFGREIQGGSGERCRRPVQWIAPCPEIHEHDASGAGHHDVLGLDIAVQQPRFVHGRHRLAQLESDRHGLRDREPSPLLEHLFEGQPSHELHRQADLVSDSLGVVDDDDVRVSDSREQAAFLDDRGASPAARRHVCRQQFERDIPVESRVVRAIDLSGGSVPDSLEQSQVSPVRKLAGTLANRRRGGRGRHCGHGAFRSQ